MTLEKLIKSLGSTCFGTMMVKLDDADEWYQELFTTGDLLRPDYKSLRQHQEYQLHQISLL